MRFTYPFQKIVDLKSKEKKLAESDLSRAIGLLTEKERQLVEVMAEKNRVQEQLAAGEGTTLPASELYWKQRYVEHLDRCIRKTAEEIESAERRVETCRTELKEKTIDYKIWLAAREKAYLSHRSAVGKKLQNLVDDIISTRWQRV